MKWKKTALTVIAMGTAALVCTSCGSSGQDATSADGSTVISIWRQGSTPIAGYEENTDQPGYSEMASVLKEKLGVELQYTTPTVGQEQQQFNLLLASRDLPDIVTFWWYDVPGGPQKAISDGYIYAMDEAFLQENAPNFLQLIQDNPVYEKGSKTDAGDYFIFPKFFDYDGEKAINLYTNGYMMRGDWLEELGLEIPETIDEWHTVLTAFKEQKGATAPLTGTELTRGFESAFGMSLDFYHDDGVVKYGYYEDGYLDYLTTLNQWYNEGLLDKNIANMDSKMTNAKMLSGESGALWGWLGSGMGTLMKAAPNETYSLVGVPAPVKNKGEKPEYNQVANPVYGSGSVINGKSEHPELAAKVLDFGYSEEGHLLANFGVEGLSYNMVDGYPQYTDKILNNEEGLSMTDALNVYTGKTAGPGAYREDYRYIQQYYNLPQQQEAQKTWMEGNGINHIMPTISYTEEENAERSKIMSEVNNYVEEMNMKFITGVEPLSNFESFRAELKKLGIERAIELTQNAYDRYMSR